MAFMSMFQIITQEGWTDVVVDILRATNENLVPLVALYFVGYHLLVTLVGPSPTPKSGSDCVVIVRRRHFG